MSDGLGAFAVELELPPGSADEFADAKAAIRTEHRGAVEALSFRCRRVEEVGRGSYRLLIGR